LRPLAAGKRLSNLAARASKILDQRPAVEYFGIRQILGCKPGDPMVRLEKERAQIW
jgi:hypothetical protein